MILFHRRHTAVPAVEPQRRPRRRGRSLVMTLALATVATVAFVPTATPANAAVDWAAGQRAIESKYNSGSFRTILGPATTGVTYTPVRQGLYRHYANGSIYWSANTGAKAIYGDIRTKWEVLGWENSDLGFPLTDELAEATPCGGLAYAPGQRHTRFEGGAICWTPGQGAGWWPNFDYRVHTVSTHWGAIEGLGRVRQALVTIQGYPTYEYILHSITCTGLTSGRSATLTIGRNIGYSPSSWVVPVRLNTAGEETRCTMNKSGEPYLPNNTVTAPLF
jgi:hypothetical protein